MAPKSISIRLPETDDICNNGLELDEGFWEVIEILKESKRKYLVKWKGVDPSTGKPWHNSWVRKEDCTESLIEDWEITKVRVVEEERKCLKRVVELGVYYFSYGHRGERNLILL
jgi:hypothetical protein